VTFVFLAVTYTLYIAVAALVEVVE
jgi:hypothetical protein